MEVTLPGEKLGLILKVGLYVFLAIAGLSFLPWLLYGLGGLWVAAAVGTFATAALANAIVVRVFERGKLADVGLGWAPGSSRNLGIGILAGIVAALCVTAVPLLVGIAELREDPAHPFQPASLLFVTVLLLFGAVGEELLFHGYAFQLLAGSIGRFATILPAAVLFGAAHMNNLNASLLGIVNTIGFGVILGYAVLRSGDLWLATGIHFGWNWVLPLFGVNLSGFTMGVTGRTLHWKVGDLWSGGQYGPEASLLTSFVVVG
ncbi:MAG TPA: type II CAAX endopeptidase family protein, partial [Bryobacteraceae bacterium]|nr:type II CAAX endopeptidase family protein [Bryobacteraceae bacterium]